MHPELVGTQKAAPGALGLNLANRRGIEMFYRRPKAVHVRSYVRFRLGRLEHVSAHFRSYPSH